MTAPWRLNRQSREFSRNRPGGVERRTVFQQRRARNIQRQRLARTIDNVSDANDSAAVTADFPNHLSGNLSGGDDVLDNSNAAASRHREPPPKNEPSTLAFKIDHWHAEMPCNLVRRQQAPDGGSDNKIDISERP